MLLLQLLLPQLSVVGALSTGIIGRLGAESNKQSNNGHWVNTSEDYMVQGHDDTVKVVIS